MPLALQDHIHLVLVSSIQQWPSFRHTRCMQIAEEDYFSKPNFLLGMLITIGITKDRQHILLTIKKSNHQSSMWN